MASQALGHLDIVPTQNDNSAKKSGLEFKKILKTYLRSIIN